jgi:hypothetical protein
MRKYSLPAVVLVVTLAGFGCGRPNSVTTFKSPTQGVFFTLETYYGHGPVFSDIAKVYAHFERQGRAKKMVVLDGENLTVAKIIWKGPHEDTPCLDGGITNTFRNRVTLILGDSLDDSETIP